MMKHKLLYLCIITFISSASLFAKSSYVSQLPNGGVFSCATCHVSNSNYSLNSFGVTVAGGYIKSGKVTWNATLAKIDSDGDGFTNGTELQDPNGAWTSGAAAPGSVSLVSNPGQKASIPPTGVENDNNLNTGIIKSLSPNPFNNSISISLNIENPGLLNAKIIDVTGNQIKDLSVEFKAAGEYNFVWNGEDENGALVNSATYYLVINLGDRIITKSIVLIK